mmetsp:Transcript_12902/g.37176  ORF Transcript_12902/g.37176 Transcript_12902/m.37176 type:complete len:297 (-) Transcript_12902:75-965(-)
MLPARAVLAAVASSLGVTWLFEAYEEIKERPCLNGLEAAKSEAALLQEKLRSCSQHIGEARRPAPRATGGVIDEWIWPVFSLKQDLEIYALRRTLEIWRSGPLATVAGIGRHIADRLSLVVSEVPQGLDKPLAIVAEELNHTMSRAEGVADAFFQEHPQHLSLLARLAESDPTVGAAARLWGLYAAAACAHVALAAMLLWPVWRVCATPVRLLRRLLGSERCKSPAAQQAEGNSPAAEPATASPPAPGPETASMTQPKQSQGKPATKQAEAEGSSPKAAEASPQKKSPKKGRAKGK